ncbi:hypothetical protein P154DRAFT_192237 [Amniculicola lignicola CBS 123094]|uniref:Oxidoreductase acuF-like C2H2 type zinc-finger domain-containing protein n=1 Tax=Amniculicola lignicola CBS 123094 TaxID=1392246 RepID=A0A6A5WSV6_9PLEO|nr:hypothetical protein P154DRAFT_192237 [Amniculicola lignicola CBS 123094]
MDGPEPDLIMPPMPISPEPDLIQPQKDSMPIVERRALSHLPPLTEGPSTLYVRTMEAIRSVGDEETMSEVSSVVPPIDLADDDEVLLRIPALQNVSQGQQEFECRICYALQSFRSQRKWKEHALSNLKPYVCSGGRAECDLQLFGDCKVWFTHELEKHRHQWTCFICQLEPYTSKARFSAHMQSKHGNVSRKLPDIAELCKQPLKFMHAADCPFCDEFDVKVRAG